MDRIEFIAKKVWEDDRTGGGEFPVKWEDMTDEGREHWRNIIRAALQAAIEFDTGENGNA